MAMDPDAVKSTMQNLAFGNVMAAAARNYQKACVAGLCCRVFSTESFFWHQELVGDSEVDGASKRDEQIAEQQRTFEQCVEERIQQVQRQIQEQMKIMMEQVTKFSGAPIGFNPPPPPPPPEI